MPDDHLATSDASTRQEMLWCETVRTSPKSREGREAFHHLYARHRDAVLGQALTMSGPSHLAEDLVAEVFAKMLRALSNGAGPTSSVLGYLLISLRHEMIRVAQVDASLQNMDPETLSDLFTESAPDISEGISDRDQILRAFAGVSAEERCVLWLVDVEQLTTAEAAEHVGVTPTTLRVQLHRARKKLATKFLQQYVEAPCDECAPVAGMLADYVRLNLKKTDSARVETHLAGCDTCTRQVQRLRALQSGLRLVVGPLLIGGTTAATLSLLAEGPPASASAASTQLASKPAILRGTALLAGLAASTALIIAGVAWLLPPDTAESQPQPGSSGVEQDSGRAATPAEETAPARIGGDAMNPRTGHLPPVLRDDATPRWRLIP